MEKVINNQNETNEKPKFYIFSGIEQTLAGQNFTKHYYRGLSSIIGELKPDPHCMDALNFLLEKLEENFDTKLVITSKQRRYPNACENYLKINNLKYNKPVFFTKYISGPRGAKIIDYLESENASPLTFHTAPLYIRFLKNFKDNPDFKNYIVLDGQQKNLAGFIPQSQLCIVNKKTGFTMENAINILQKNGIAVEQQPNAMQ